MASISFLGVDKRFPDGTEAVSQLSLDVADGEFLVLVGPSGSGKTTALRMVAGLEELSSGDILIGGDVVNDVPAKNRDIAMVFQNYALYPHMTVAANMGFALKLHGVSKKARDDRVQQTAEMLGISELLGRKPAQLSGGQRQRVAMGRAIVRQPQAFLMDEPLSNLDAKLRVDMRAYISMLHRRLRTTTLYVTHDQTEAMTMGDRVAVMRAGRLEQVATPHELYRRPRNLFVASFIGSPAMNFIPCQLEDAAGKLQVRLTDKLAFPLPPARAARYQKISRADKLLLGIRPEHVTEASAHIEPGVEPFNATLDVTEPMGMETLIYFNMHGAQVCGRVSPNAGAQDGAPLRLAVDLNNMHLLNEVTGAVL